MVDSINNVRELLVMIIILCWYFTFLSWNVKIWAGSS